VGDRKMLIGEPPAGLLVPRGMPPHGRAIVELLTHPELAGALRQRGLERGRGTTSGTAGRGKLEAVYQQRRDYRGGQVQ